MSLVEELPPDILLVIVLSTGNVLDGIHFFASSKKLNQIYKSQKNKFFKLAYEQTYELYPWLFDDLNKVEWETEFIDRWSTAWFGRTTYTFQCPEITNPFNLTISEETREILVSSSESNTIEIYNLDNGKHLKTLTHKGMDFPTDTLIVNGLLYVADFRAKRILLYNGSPDYEFKKVWLEISEPLYLDYNYVDNLIIIGVSGRVSGYLPTPEPTLAHDLILEGDSDSVYIDYERQLYWFIMTDLGKLVSIKFGTFEKVNFFNVNISYPSPLSCMVVDHRNRAIFLDQDLGIQIVDLTNPTKILRSINPSSADAYYIQMDKKKSTLFIPDTGKIDILI